ncbi:hypothetical protein [Nonomuraea sp. NPDC049709]|uniref:hypothetical protein n=1 Tax=Nonomuraea sp. NPDC049709 TaxID=3154736 RepID=UPI003434AC8C
MLSLPSDGEAVAPAHAHAARYFTRPGIAYVPIRDAPPARWALIWRTATESTLIRALARVAADIGTLAG